MQTACKSQNSSIDSFEIILIRSIKRNQSIAMKKILAFILGAAVLAGCGTMQGGFGKPSQLRCSCGLSLGHTGAHASTISDFINAKKQHEHLAGSP
jgi:hypothetical protein